MCFNQGRCRRALHRRDYTMSETWLPVVGFEGLYEVSDTGLVRTLEREWRSGRNHTLIRIVKPGLKSQRTDKDGYLSVKLRKDGEVFSRVKVHHLVLEAFIDTRPEGMIGCHRDHSRDNNNVDNLYWGTCKDNSQDMLNNPNYKHARGMLGKRHSLETRKKMSASHQKKRRKKLCPQT